MFKKFTLAIAGLFASLALALPAQAQRSFDFSFVAPLTNGDVASGSGTLVTTDPDIDGDYYFLSATGSFAAYDGDPNPRTIDGAIGMTGLFNLSDGYLYQDVNGAFVTDGVAFYNNFFFDGIGFWDAGNGMYDGFFSEVGVAGASLVFLPSAAGVPEPASWAMLILGFGAAGALLRRGRGARRARLA